MLTPKRFRNAAAVPALGVEAPLWAETLMNVSDYEYMAFPRLIGVAEIGWTPQSLRTWDGYKSRLDDQARRLNALGVNTPRQ